ncbi:MAG: sialate O-acetylesterase [Bacteroidota bacterium]
MSSIMKTCWLGLLLFFFCTLTGQAQVRQFEKVEEKQDTGLDLFILAGQSNMSGRGSLADFDNTIDIDILLFGNDDEWYYAQEPTDHPFQQIDQASLDNGAAVSPGLSFARAYKQNNPGRRVGLIPTAKGGTALAEWKKGAPLYQSMVRRAKAAAKHGTIKGILFFQGESDANDPGLKPDLTLHAADWDQIFKQFVQDVRADLGNSDLPIVFAQIGNTTNHAKFVNWDLVQTRQAAVDLPNVGMITTFDLQLRDYVHFDTKSYVKIGHRFARRYQKMWEESTTRVDAINQALRTPNDDQVLVVAHRGDWRDAPENSLQAIQNSIDMGVDIVEIDIRMTKDGHLILMHDETLERTSTGKGYVRDWTLDSIRTLRLQYGLDQRRENHPVPTLVEAMELARGNILLYLDKSIDKVPEVLAFLKKTNTLDHAVFMLPLTYQQAREAFGDDLERINFIPRIELDVSDPQQFIDDYLEHFKPIAFQLRLPAETGVMVDLIRTIRDKSMRVCVSTLWDYYSGNHDDDRAFHDPDAHWGWQVRQGVNIINTDRPRLLIQYLKQMRWHH